LASRRLLQSDMSLTDDFFQPLIEGETYVLQVHTFISKIQQYLETTTEISSMSALRKYINILLRRSLVRASQKLIGDHLEPDFISDISCEIIDTGPCVGLLTNRGIYHLLSKGSVISENLFEDVQTNIAHECADAETLDTSVEPIGVQAYQSPVLTETFSVIEEDLQLGELPEFTFSVEHIEPDQHRCSNQMAIELSDSISEDNENTCQILVDDEMAIVVTTVTTSSIQVGCHHHVEHINEGTCRRRMRDTICDDQHTLQCDEHVAMKRAMRKQLDAHVLHTMVWKNRFKTLNLMQHSAARILGEHRYRDHCVVYQSLTATARSRDLATRSEHNHPSIRKMI